MTRLSIYDMRQHLLRAEAYACKIREVLYNTFNDFVNFFGIFINFSSSSRGSIYAASKTTTPLQYPNTYSPKTNVSQKERKVLNIIDVPFTIHFKRSEHQRAYKNHTK